jgi:hypothetical protein
MLNVRGTLLTSFGAGVGLMYFLDPGRGRRRRAMLRDQLTRASRVSADALGATGRDVAHRSSGAMARLRGALHHEIVDDSVLVERVRAKLGRAVSHPRAIEVKASDGIVRLRGPVIKAEVKGLLKAVERTAGVRDVISELQEYKQPGNEPALQGGSTLPGWQAEILRGQWSPTTRLLTGTAGLALASYGALRRGAPGWLLTGAGIGLAARAGKNLQGR